METHQLLRERLQENEKKHFLEKSSLITSSSIPEKARITFVWYPEQKKKKNY